jgi:lipopolysaccharide/colanic/teichoic acid biosynthesis glycosyltransferase
MLPIMIILKTSDEHYVFYKQSRVGRHGKEFNLLKFATMLKDSPNLIGGYFTYENDPRILPLGKFLRKTKINELPQLINVFLGQMSIVGYRPLVRQGYEKYSDKIKRKIYNMKPGLSGIGSIALRSEEDIMKNIDDKETFYQNIIMPYKGDLESWYVDNYTISNYIKIIFITIVVVINPHSNIFSRTFRHMPVPPKELDEKL